MQRVTFTSGVHELSGRLALPEASEQAAGVVLFHGLNSSADSHAQLAENLASKGIAALAVSMRAHGLSNGDFAICTMGEALDDGPAAYDFLASQEIVDSNRIGLFGSSAGAVLVAAAIAERETRSLALRAPAAYTPEMLQRTMADIKTNQGHLFHEISNPRETPALQGIRAYSGCLLVVASENDVIIPAKITDEFIRAADKAARKELVVLRGAPHGLKGGPWKDECNRIVSDWFFSTL